MTNANNNPELHVYEEQRDDLMDTAVGFGVFFAVLIVIAIAATAISLLAK